MARLHTDHKWQNYVIFNYSLSPAGDQAIRIVFTERIGEQPVNKKFTEECTKMLNAVSDALYAVAGKWKLMISIAMASGNNRFTELQKLAKGISDEAKIKKYETRK